ncbi:hypothetical protein ACFL5X_03860 [Candidatus Omnitrophota bacterium]
MKKQKYSRRHYFIDKQFQTNFILKFCLIVLVSSVLIGALVLLLSKGSTTVAIENTKVQVKTTSDFILPILLQTIAVVSLFSAFAVGFLSLVSSHKISGPLFRLKREIDILKDGDLGRNFNIRASDQLQALSKSLSEMSVNMRRRYVEVKDKCKDLKGMLEEKKYSLSAEDKAQVAKILAEIDITLKRFKT